MLAAGAPQHTPFMADESMQGLGLHSLTYTLPAYMDYAQQVATLTKTLKKQGKAYLNGESRPFCKMLELGQVQAWGDVSNFLSKICL